jgi:deoxyxylulose-5-phosphate synthase
MMPNEQTRDGLIAFEKHIAALYDAGDLPYLVHLAGGNEDQLIGIFKSIRSDDYVISTHRNHYHYLLHGGSPEDLESKIRTGKSMFVFNRSLNFLSFSIVAAGPAIAAGIAWALKQKGSSKKVWCFIGDAGEDEGHFFEAVRYVDGWDLPCTFIIEDNDRSVSATVRERRGKALDFPWPDCVRRYHYVPTYPHAGSGTPGWLKFKREAETIPSPERKSSDLHEVRQDLGIGYMDAVRLSNETLAREGAIFIGYNVRHASAYGALKNIPDDQRLETPVAENLMLGISMGMSLEGFRPVVFFERHEFVLNAMDAIVNTLDVIEAISDGEFCMPVIIKAVAGSIKPFYAGLTHARDFSDAIRNFVHFPVYEPQTGSEVVSAYELASQAKGPVMISEKKELY